MSNRTIFFGLLLIILGMVFLGRSMDLFHFSIGDLFGMFVPIAFIALGIWLILRRKGSPRPQQWQPPGEPPPVNASYGAQAGATTTGQAQPEGAPTGSADPSAAPRTEKAKEEAARISAMPNYGSSGKLKYDKFLGDMFIDCANVNLQNIEVSSFVGDIEIKLHGGSLAPGLNRMVISGFIGDVRILVPREMAVYIQASNFIGDVEIMGRNTSGFGNNLDAQTTNYQAAEAKLFIASNQFVGDVRAYVV